MREGVKKLLSSLNREGHCPLYLTYEKVDKIGKKNKQTAVDGKTLSVTS